QWHPAGEFRLAVPGVGRPRAGPADPADQPDGDGRAHVRAAAAGVAEDARLPNGHRTSAISATYLRRHETRQDILPQELRLDAAVMAAVVAGPRRARLPRVLVAPSVGGAARRACAARREAVPARRAATGTVGRPDNPYAHAEHRQIPAAIKHVDTAAAGAEGRSKVVVLAHGRGEQNHAVEAVRRQSFR